MNHRKPATLEINLKYKKERNNGIHFLHIVYFHLFCRVFIFLQYGGFMNTNLSFTMMDSGFLTPAILKLTKTVLENQDGTSFVQENLKYTRQRILELKEILRKKFGVDKDYYEELFEITEYQNFIERNL